MNLDECNAYLAKHKYIDVKLTWRDRTIIRMIKHANTLYFSYLPNEIKCIIIDILSPHSTYSNKIINNNLKSMYINQILLSFIHCDCYVIHINNKYIIIENTFKYDFKAKRHSSRNIPCHGNDVPLLKVIIDNDNFIYIWPHGIISDYDTLILKSLNILGFFCNSLGVCMINYIKNTPIEYKPYYKVK